MKTLVITVLASLSVIGFSSASQACDYPDMSPQELVDRVDVIFVGSPQETEELDYTVEFSNTARTKFSVVDVWKGLHEDIDTVDVYHDTQSSCQVGFQRGKTIVVAGVVSSEGFLETTQWWDFELYDLGLPDDEQSVDRIYSALSPFLDQRSTQQLIAPSSAKPSEQIAHENQMAAERASQTFIPFFTGFLIILVVTGGLVFLYILRP